VGTETELDTYSSVFKGIVINYAIYIGVRVYAPDNISCI